MNMCPFEAGLIHWGPVCAMFPLQTQPQYLAQLIFLMPQNKSTSFMETVIFTLFNYGSDCREAYLMLQLFTTALRHEIK